MARLLFLAVILMAVGSVHSIQRQLGDYDFEKVTQAATGQTTGVWVIKFCHKGVPKCDEVQQEWDSLADELLAQQIFLAEVEVEDNYELAVRFDIGKFPTVILFRNQQMYKFPADAFEGNFAAGVRLFATSGWEQTKGRPVPAEHPSILAKIGHWLHSWTHLGGLLMGVLAAVGILASLIVQVAKPKVE